MGCSMKTWASGELHLTFHMGSSTGGQAFVGGTLVNTGDAPVAHGYVVVTLLDGQCRPLRSVLESFGVIGTGQKYGFRIAVQGGLQRYRLLSVRGFDAEGFEVRSVDDNEVILKARDAEERACCAQSEELYAQLAGAIKSKCGSVMTPWRRCAGFVKVAACVCTRAPCVGRCNRVYRFSWSAAS